MDLTSILLDQSPWLGDRAQRIATPWPVRRDLHDRVLGDLLDPDRRRATVVLGPRHVGKTVLLQQLAEDLLGDASSPAGGWPPQNLVYFDFSDDRLVEAISVRDVLDALPRAPLPDAPRILLLDEVRRVPRWDRWLKRAVDQSRDRIVVTHSAAGLLREGSRESGMGRWDERELHGLSFGEFARISRGKQGSANQLLAEDPALLGRYLVLGGFPAHHAAESASLVRKTIREDVIYRALERDLVQYVDDVESARRLFVYLAQDSGAIFNATARGKDIGTGHKQAGNWARIFLDSRLLVPLPKRELNVQGAKSKAADRLGAHPRIYATDHGLITAFSPLPDPYQDPEVRGQIFESVVFRHLRDLDERGTISDLIHYRERDRFEVDFVLDRPDGCIALEVTASEKLAGKPEKLRAASRRLGARGAVLVHGGTADETSEGVRFLPLSAFLTDPQRVLRGGAE